LVQKEVELRLTKLADADDIEAYLTTFERMMGAYEIDKTKWAFRLAPQLTGKAQQAYAAMASADAGKYDELKAAILRRYDINEETYRQRFRSASKKEEESYRQLAIRADDLLGKWTKDCKTVKDIRHLVATEQVLESLPEELRIWVRERKPKTAEEAGQLADDYLQARKSTAGTTGDRRDKTNTKKSQGGTVVKCGNCGKQGHAAKECWRGTASGSADTSSKKGTPSGKRSTGRENLRCFNCQERGHFAADCPKPRGTAMLGTSTELQQCPGTLAERVSRRGTVERQEVPDIILDTGTFRTMVRKSLVPPEKMVVGEVHIRCAHGDVVTYPLAQIDVGVGGATFSVEAAVADKLPVSVLLGTDVPEMLDLLSCSQGTGKSEDLDRVEDVVGVTTRAQQKKQEQEATAQEEKERSSGVRPKPLNSQPEESEEANLPGSTFDDDLFGKCRDRARLSRAEKRADKYKFTQEQQPRNPLDLNTEELIQLQKEDDTLESAWKAAKGEVSTAGPGFFERDGILYRRWIPHGQDDDTPIEQLVLPTQHRGEVLKLAHEIPMAGHMGKTKTASRILQRFYWPSVFRDVAEHCKTCAECQKAAPGKAARAPLVPLQIIDEPFQRIAMDIVGPLPRSRSGNKYVLVLCDYATRYPEAIPLRSIDASTIAEELVKMFARVGVPGEILTDQGSNFTSQLLAEIYRLLHIKPIKTSPYHPQTDGLVERFNQTLKAMLRKAATDEGKDWDKWVPYLLFAYREVPQASTGFSPFELLYGRPVRGPLDILKETWESSSKSSESIVSYVLDMQGKLAKMSEMARENLAQARTKQKQWYDQNARERRFEPGEQVLVLLPTSTSKLLAQWQGPYPVLRRIGETNYQIDMVDKRKRKRIFHVNMLRKWHTPTVSSMWTGDEPDAEADEVLLWKDDEGGSNQPLLGDQLSANERKRLQTLLEEFQEVFQSEPGRTNLTEHSINTGAAPPSRQPPYRVPFAYRETVLQELKDMERTGVIEPSTSEWAAPIVLVKKKDGTLRFCVDYRRFNSVSQVDAYPMPRIDELIDRLGKAKYISTLDLARGYWQVPMEEESRHKTAFTTPYGLYQFRVMPFGLQGAPATFQRMMDTVVRGMQDISAAYLDDLVVFSNSFDEHIGHLRRVLERLREAGLTAKAKKCQIAMEKCTYLGHVVGGGNVYPEHSKIEAVSSFPTPVMKKQVRTFLGMTGYYRKFIPDYATTAAPLTDLIRKNCPNRVEWTPLCEVAFAQLKAHLCSSPVLKGPDFDKQFILQTDASDRGIGAVLSQLDDEGNDHPVAYFSRKLLPREEKYSTIEKECLAIKLSIHAFRVYLLGKEFVIQTDHRALEWLDRLKESNARLTRWSLALQPYQFVVRYRAGKKNGNADALSRVDQRDC
jgi:hypothetical protein